MSSIIKRRSQNLKKLLKEPLVLFIIIACFLLILNFIIYPLFSVFRESVMNEEGEFVGLSNYIAFLKSPYFRQVLLNTFFITTLSTLGALLVGIVFAYGVTRTTIPIKPFFMVMAILPMITPPFVNAFAFILLFGRRGLVNIILHNLFGIKYIIYGWHGVVFSQIITTFPLVFLVTSAAFSGIDASLEDSAFDLGAKDFKVLKTITFPLITPAIMAAALLVYMTNLSAFGAPALLGGGISVLAVESVMQILGVMDWGMGTTICIILLVPSFLLFYVQSVYKRKRSYVTVTGKPTHVEVRPTPKNIKLPIFIFCLLISALILTLYTIIFLGGFAKVWGIDKSFTLDHYRLVFSVAWKSIRNSIVMASIGALFAAFLGMIIAYLMVRREFPGKKIMDFTATLPYAVPGTMIGLGFVVAFNKPPLLLTGTAIIIIMDYAIRRMPFGLRTGVATLKQIDIALEEASADLGAPWIYTFRRVVLPLLKPAFIAGITFAFIRAITELTSTIFLVTPRYRVMAVDIYNFVQSGSLGAAAAMSSLLMIIVVLLLMILYRLSGAKMSILQL